MPAGGPFDPHPEWPAAASWFLVPAHPARGCASNGLRASGTRKMFERPTSSVECCADSGRRRAARRQTPAIDYCRTQPIARACAASRTRPRRANHAGRPQSYARSYDARARGAIKIDRSIRARLNPLTCASAHQCVSHEFADTRQKLGAHGRVEAFRIAGADRQNSQLALWTQGGEGHRAYLYRVLAEKIIALRIANLP